MATGTPQSSSLRVIYIFIFLLIFSPLAFGTVEPWSLAVMESLCVSALVIFLIGKRREKDPFLYEVPGLLPLSLLLGYVFLQLVPLPPGVLKIVSPGTYALYKDTTWAANPGAWVSVSISNKATLSEFFRLVSYAAFYVLTVQLLTRKELLKKTVGTVVVFASVLAFFGMIQHFLWNDKIYWVRELTRGGVPFGPYVNRNHYAGLIDMVIPLAVSLFIYYRPRYFNDSLKDRAVEAFSNPRTNVHILLGFSGVLMATSVFLSLSKGGILSLCLSLVFLAGVIRNKGKEWKGWLLVAFILTLVFYSVGWFGWDRVFERFTSLRDAQGNISDARVDIWRDSLNITKDFAVTGTGLGSYIRIYPKYRTVSAEGIVDHAHNDYLELFSEGGAVAVLLFGWFVATAIHKAYNRFRGRRDRYSVYLFMGAVSGIVSMLIHSLTDFNLHIGANGLYFFFLIGLAVSAANTRIHDGPAGTLLGRARPFLSKGLLVTALVVLVTGTVFIAGVLAARVSFFPYERKGAGPSTSREELIGLRNAARRASSFDMTEGRYPFAAAGAEWVLGNKGEAVGQYKKAVRLDPVNGEYLQALGLRMAGSGDDRVTARLLQSGITYDKTDPLMYKRYVIWLITKGDKETASKYLSASLALTPEKTREYIAMLVLDGWTDMEIRGVLPALVKPHLLFGDYLDKTRRQDMADEEYRSSLDYVNNEKQLEAGPFYKAHEYFMKRGMYDDAVTVMRKAGDALPKDAGIRMTLADTYAKAGIPYRAAEEYRKALILDPGNSRAKKKLEEIK
jgi:O-antigen ligase/tetratricopeptide (TPR) repeat protein